jgi:ceramide glucosyltransferase
VTLLATLALVGAVAGGAFQLVSLSAALRLLGGRRRAAGPRAPLPRVTVLKPVRGAGDGLYENLATFCRQDYPAHQIVIGVDDPDDPAVPVVRRLKRDFPHLDIVLAVGSLPGTNRKIANVLQMMQHARHDVLVLSDADVRVQPDYLAAVVAPLEDPEVGLTTCLYRAVGGRGLPALVESLLINTWFIPMALTAGLRPLRHAFGATIAVKRAALEASGGFRALSDHLADDYLLGHRVAAAGYRVALLPYVVETFIDSTTLAGVWRHQLRWVRTYRVCQPLGWALSIVTHATLWGVLAVAACGGASTGWLLLAALLGLRLTTLVLVLARLGERRSLRGLWLVPAADLLASALWAAGFLGRRVEWGGRTYHVRRDGSMLPLAGHDEAAPPASAELSPPAARRVS